MNIHEPTDSSLLWDCVRVLTRLMGVAHDDFGLTFNDHSRRARRRSLGIRNAKTEPDRVALYRDLIKVTCKTVALAPRSSVTSKCRSTEGRESLTGTS